MLAVIIAFIAAAPANAESFKSWAARGAREEREKDPKAAFSSYSNALSLWEDDDGAAGKAKVLCARSGLREKDGDDAGALEDLSECLALDKKSPKAFHRRGLLLLKAGKTAAAISDFYKAVALDIGFGQAYADRARAYELQGEQGFAREDYKNACGFGVKAACAKARSMPAPKKTAKAAKAAAPDEPEAAAEEAAPEPEPEAEAQAEPPPEKPARPSKKTPPAGKASSYRPKFKDCLEALDACVENGDSFGACVHRAPDCSAKAVKGCCPAACLKAYQKSINREKSEAEAFREHFNADAACGVPPKEDDGDVYQPEILDKR